MPDKIPLSVRLDNNIAASRQQKKPRVQMWKEISRFQTGNHWGIKWHQLEADDDRVFPSVQFSWAMTDQMRARIFDRPLKPVITAEQPVNYPLPRDHPWIQITQQVKAAQLFDQQTDSEIASQLMSNILDYEWDAVRIESKLMELVDLGLWFGTGILLDGYDDFEITLGEKSGVFVDFIHPRDFYIDTMASSLNNARWCAYVSLKSIDWIEERWPNSVDDIKKEIRSTKGHEANTSGDRFEILDQFDQSDQDRSNENRVLETHFIRDFSTESRTIEVPTGEFEAVFSELTGMPLTDDMGMQMERELTEKSTIKIPDFRNGWRTISKIGSVVLNPDKDEQELDSPNGQLPLHAFRPWREPTKFWGMGAVEQVRHLNFLLDKSLKYAVENANRTSNNQYIVDDTLVEDVDELFNNERGGIIRGAFGGNIKNAIVQFPGMQLPTAHVTMINLLREIQDNITGITDLRFRQDMPKDASGRFVEALEQGGNSRITMVRKELVTVIKSLSHNIIAQNIDKADQERIVKITRTMLDEPTYIEFNPTVLAFRDQDFEARFDVEVPADDALSVSPQAQDAQTIATIKELAALGPSLAAETIKLIHVPNKKAISKALVAFFREQQQQAQQGQQDPAQQKIKADQNEAMSQIVRRVGESTADAIENLSKDLGDERPDIADQLIRAMPSVVAENVRKVIQELGSALTGGPNGQQEGLTPEQMQQLQQDGTQGVVQ